MTAQSQVTVRRIVLAGIVAAGVLVVITGLRRAPPSWQPAAVIQPPHVIAGAVERIRNTPSHYIGDHQESAMVTGIAFGRTQAMPSTMRDDFRASGLWHLLAASGQNVELVAGMCIWLSWLAGAGRLSGSIIGMLAIAGYVLCAGGGASLVRAAIMGELAMLCWLDGRLRDMIDAILLSGAIIVWVWPGSYDSLGLQLSYACVVSLVAACSWLAALLEHAGCPRVVARLASPTICCSLATAPLLLATVGAAPGIGLVANLVAVPLAGVILVLALIGCLLDMAIPVAAAPVFSLAAHAAGLLAWIGHRAALLGGQVHSWSALITVEACALLATALVRLCVWRMTIFNPST